MERIMNRFSNFRGSLQSGRRFALMTVLLLAPRAPETSRADIVKIMDVLHPPASGRAESRWTPGTNKAAASSDKPGANEARRFPAVLQCSDGGSVFQCSFSETGASRLWWDHPVELDLSDMHAVEIELSCERPDALRSFGFYLRSGDGWYVWITPAGEAGRHLICLPIEKASIEGRPAGWNAISGVRIAFTAALDANAAVKVHSLRSRAFDAVVVEGSLSVSEPAEKRAARSAARRISGLLDDAGISHALMSDEAVVSGKLRHSKAAVLPYNSLPPKRELAELASFVRRGGKLIVFYSSSKELADLMEMKLGEYKAEKKPGQWSGFAFNSLAPAHLPDRVFQESRNIRPVYPGSSDSRVIAYWSDADGKESADPAWVQSGRGFWMSHVMLDGDERNKAKTLAGLLGFCDDSIWRMAARRAMQKAGGVGGYENLEEAVSGIGRRALGMQDGGAVRELLARANGLSDRMRKAWEAAEYADVVDASAELRASLMEAYARAQRPAAGEFRGVWDHSGTGLYPGDWDRTCKLLADNGINAVFPNVLWPGQAHYPSSIAPSSYAARAWGDQLASCLKAASSRGLQVHAWKVCWNLERADETWVKSLEEQGRLQMTSGGSVVRWLCPSHPANAALELDAVSELLRAYKVNGIHLDYIRYPHGDACFCPGCRARFERFLGRRAEGWPQSASAGPLRDAYVSWRSGRITAFVRSVRETAKRIAPGVNVSAAVYPGYPGCRTSVGQDWARWLEEGDVDFVCPMNYVSNSSSFKEMTAAQLGLLEGAGRVFPGIGATAAESRLTADMVMDQIEIVRSVRRGGFMLFKLDRVLEKDVLPLLGLGVTRQPQQAARGEETGL